MSGPSPYGVHSAVYNHFLRANTVPFRGSGGTFFCARSACYHLKDVGGKKRKEKGWLRNEWDGEREGKVRLPLRFVQRDLFMRCIRNSHCRGAFAGFTVAVDYFVRKGLISTLEATGIRGLRRMETRCRRWKRLSHTFPFPMTFS